MNVRYCRGMSRWFVYVLRCQDDSLYTGITTDVTRRFAQHRSATGAKYTRSRGVRSIVFVASMDTPGEARRLEAQIKRYRRAEKLALIDGFFDDK